MSAPALRRQLSRAARASSKLGLPAFAVGGCVRDALLGQATKDVDIVIEGPVEAVLGELGADAGKGARMFDRFGTARWALPGGGRIDLARARKETYPTPAALPVVEPADIRTDLRRRDFTINAMAVPLEDFARGRRTEPLDPFGGLADLRGREIRILHGESFRDDPTRIFRAARFAARFGFRLAGPTSAALIEAVDQRLPRLLSRERLREELLRILEEKEPGKVLSLLKDWGALDPIAPDLKWNRDTFESPDHWVRLGLLAFALGEKRGGEFLDSLRLEHGVRRALGLPLVLSARAAGPREPLPSLSAEVLRRALPALPAAALKSPLAGGEELKKLGLRPGPLYARILGELARAQWSGEVRTRRQALSWLKARSRLW